MKSVKKSATYISPNVSQNFTNLNANASKLANEILKSTVRIVIDFFYLLEKNRLRMNEHSLLRVLFIM